MINELQARGALLNLLSPVRKEIFFFVNPIQVGTNDFLHAIYFFTISNDRLFNISPLIAALLGLPVTESNRVTNRGPGDWCMQAVNAAKQKLGDPMLSFLSLNEALPTAELRLTVDGYRTPEARDVIDQSQADDPNRPITDEDCGDGKADDLNRDIDPNDPF